MRVLLDTHLVLCAMKDDKRLSATARSEINRASTVYVSAASLWDISIKIRLGKLQVDPNKLIASLRDAGFEPLPITWEHAAAVGPLPDLHRDPFDRMLVAQAITEPVRLLTHDATMAKYSDLVSIV